MSKKVNTILLIDDDLAINFLHKRLLTKVELAQTIISSFNGVEAIKDVKQLNNSLGTNDLVLIFLDINMPIMDGWHFLEDFKEFSNELLYNFKIFVLSSSFNPDDIEKARNNSFVTDYCSKPLSSDRLNSLIDQYL
jgi:response regulator of citrate/malate metabolism